MKLKKIEIHKYKSIESKQVFEVDENITVLVGMNESGKTAVLEAIAKTNYFDEDEKFKYNVTHDYPRKEKKVMEKRGITPDAVTSTYIITDELLRSIENDIGQEIIKDNTVSVTQNYNNEQRWTTISIDKNKFIREKSKSLSIFSKTLSDKLTTIKSYDDFSNIVGEYKDDKLINGLMKLEKYFKNLWGWGNPIAEYITRTYIKPNLPKYLYYDEYYSLPSRISIEKLNKANLKEEELKTAKALFELAEINIDELLHSDNFEDFKAELEATEAIISEELFQYWSTNNNLEIVFDIDKIEGTDNRNNTRIVEHVLDVRVRNRRARMSLPLKNRSKGFNWFFSFLVWFKKIQEDNDSRYILLLDEPGLNLHASAQADLLRFISDLSNNYQIIYTTHSPFMVESNKLNQVRTILETDKGSVISDSIQEKDPDTLFPLQAALGYDVAQNLFISNKNLLVEGISDLVYLQVLSSVLEEEGRVSLSDEITIVPVGGLDKVSVFISLMRGSDLEIVCLLDSSIDTRSKQKLNNLIEEKLIKKSKVLFFNMFIDNVKEADIEDLFTEDEYLQLFNEAFNEYDDINKKDLNSEIDRILLQISLFLNIKRFNHYRPAKLMLGKSLTAKDFEKTTLDRFENMFEKVNSLFS
ncbi:MAG: AAA family ATPase [bacterium]